MSAVIVGGEALPQPPRRINFVGNGNEGDWTRGWGIYEQVAELLPHVARVGTRLELETDRCGLYVVRMPTTAGVVEALEAVAAKPCGCRVVVDVCADVWDPAAALVATDPRWWRVVARPYLERAVRAADLVTVPNPRLAEHVWLHLSRRVAVVPDCPDGEIGTEAMLAWSNATLLAVQRDRAGER